MVKGCFGISGTMTLARYSTASLAGRRLQSVAPIAKRKLDHLHSATSLSDLRAIPGNRLEALSGDREGQYSIRINDRWRACFRWVDSDACDVEIVDYQ